MDFIIAQESHEPGVENGQAFGRSLHSEGIKDEWMDDMDRKKTDLTRRKREERETS